MIKMGNEYADDGVKIIEILTTADAQRDLQDYVTEYDEEYTVVRTDPPPIMQADFEKTEIFLGCGHTAMINLQNMSVLEHTCGTTVEQAEACIQKHL